MLYEVLKPILFRMDAESAHEFGVQFLSGVQRRQILLRALTSLARPRPAPLNLWNLQFPNPLGIAAGFDKNAIIVEGLQALGFGFVEIGTVTPRAQDGNPKPRMFRYPQQKALINRLGFNNEGAEVVRKRLDVLRSRDVLRVPLFVNIGKNRDVGLEDAAEDYARCYELLAPAADAIVVNISSPNTPGLRDLQSVAHVERLFSRLRETQGRLKLEKQPILLKIAPDLDDRQLEELVIAARRLADGITATNTTTDRSALPPSAERQGGVSGLPLTGRSTEVVRRTRAIVGPDFPLIGVGGIMNARDLQERVTAGANLVQVYTSFVYEGPFTAKKMLKVAR